MGIISEEQAEKLGGGSGKYFKIEDKGEKKIRFLWNSLNDIVRYAVHELREGNNFATIDCGRNSDEDPVESCKYCAAGNKAVGRVCIPLWNEEEQCIQYWKRSTQFIIKTVKPQIEEIQGNIAGQVYKIKRIGDDLKTEYTLIPIGASDNKDAKSFGEVESPFEINMISKANSDFATTGENVSNNNYGATRRTADIF